MIKRLPEDVIAKIAAGEVVDKPSYVLKELLENSCDAASTEIIVHIENVGMDLIKVIDNGVGISKDELCKAPLKYTTNRLYNLAGLSNICSYGFRGEALHAISSVSDFQLTSKPKGQDFARRISKKLDGKFSNLDIVAAKNGTTVSVRNLFLNFPVKRLFLDVSVIEFAQLDYIFKCFALSNFGVHFILYKGEVEMRNLPICTDLYSKMKRIENLLGKRFVSKCIYISTKIKQVKMYGLITSFEYIKMASNYKFFFLNGRIINDDLVCKAIKNAYNRVYSSGSNPNYCLYLNVDPSFFDLNIHPKKKEVKFRDSDYMYRFIFNSVVDFLLLDKKIINENNIRFSESLELYDFEGEEKDYLIIDNNIGPRDIYKSKDGVLTVLDNKIMLFEYDKKIYMIDLSFLRKKIIATSCVNDFLKNKKLSSLCLSLFGGLYIKNSLNLSKTNKFFCVYGFDLEYIKSELISIKRIPFILRGLSINWKLLLNSLSLFFYSQKDSDSFLKHLDNYVIFLFNKYVYCKGPYCKDEINLFYEHVIKLKKYDEKWFSKNSLEVTYKKLYKK